AQEGVPTTTRKIDVVTGLVIHAALLATLARNVKVSTSHSAPIASLGSGVICGGPVTPLTTASGDVGPKMTGTSYTPRAGSCAYPTCAYDDCFVAPQVVSENELLAVAPAASTCAYGRRACLADSACAASSLYLDLDGSQPWVVGLGEEAA